MNLKKGEGYLEGLEGERGREKFCKHNPKNLKNHF